MFKRAFLKGLSGIGFKPTYKRDYSNWEKSKDETANWEQDLKNREKDWDKIGKDYQTIFSDFRKDMHQTIDSVMEDDVKKE